MSQFSSRCQPGGSVRERAGEQDRQPLGGDADAGLVEGDPVDHRVAPQRHQDRQHRDRDRRDREPALDQKQAERHSAHADAERDVPVMGQHRETGRAEDEELSQESEPFEPGGDEHPAQDHRGREDVGHQIRDEPGQRGERRAEQDRQHDVRGPRGLQKTAPRQHGEQDHDQDRMERDDAPFPQRRRRGGVGEDRIDRRADDLRRSGALGRDRGGPLSGRARREAARHQTEGLLHGLAALVEIAGAVEENQRPAIEQGGPEQEKDRGQEKREPGGHGESL